MYICKDCGLKFENPLCITERHSLSAPPYESIYVCPRCKSTTFKKCEIKYCRCCGARLQGEQTVYCSSSCKEKGDKLWKKQLQQRKKLYEHPLFTLVREVDDYNQKHKTRLSYGQYVALIKRPKKKKEHRNDR